MKVSTLHFDSEKAFRKMIVYCIHFAASQFVPPAVVDSWHCRGAEGMSGVDCVTAIDQQGSCNM